MRAVREILLVPAAAFAAGIVISVQIGLAIPVLLVGLGLLAILWRLSRASPVRHVACAATFLIAGALANEYHRPGPAPELDAASGEILLLSGCIVEPVTQGDALVRFVLELEPGARVRVSLRDDQPPPLRYGQRIEVEARVRKPRNFANPGAFDYAGWLARQEIFWLASVRGTDTLRILPGRCGSPVQRLAMHIREGVVGRIGELYPPDSYEAQILPALLVAHDSGNDREWTEGFRRTGTYHALVVSGLHIAVVAGFLLFLLRFAGLPPGPVLVLTALVAWGYAAVVNWEPPVVRSAAGFTLFLLARWFFRRGRVLNLLAGVLLAILALDPLAVYDASLQLTVLSVAAIGGLAVPAAERWLLPYARSLRHLSDARGDYAHPPPAAQFRIELRLAAETAFLYTRMPERLWCALIAASGRLSFWIAESALIAACVQLALAVPLALYFHTFSATAVGANVIVAPALSLAVPAGLLAALTGFPLFTALASVLVHFARIATEHFERVEPAMRVPDPPVWIAAAALLATLALSLGLIYRRGWWPLAATATLVACACMWIAPFPPQRHPGELELTLIDVGQGDSMLVTAPDGQTMLMDAGGIPVFDGRKATLDPGEDVVSPYLWRRGFRRLDVVAASHFHEDHVGGLPAVIRNFRPSELWLAPAPDHPSFRAVREAAAAAGTRVRYLRRGSEVSLGAVAIDVVAPAQAYQPGEVPDNRDSLVLLLRFGRHSLLLTGDADAVTEYGIDATEVDVLKVAHHGSRSSTTPEFLDRAQPLFAGISAGLDNSYGHPHPDVLRRLRRSGTRAFRTDVDGLVTFRTDGHRIVVERPATRLQED